MLGRDKTFIINRRKTFPSAVFLLALSYYLFVILKLH